MKKYYSLQKPGTEKNVTTFGDINTNKTVKNHNHDGVPAETNTGEDDGFPVETDTGGTNRAGNPIQDSTNHRLGGQYKRALLQDNSVEI